MTSKTEGNLLIALKTVFMETLNEMCMLQLAILLADNKGKPACEKVAALFAKLGIDPDNDNDLFGMLETTREMAECFGVDVDRYLQWLRSELESKVYKQTSVEAILNDFAEVSLWNSQVIDLFRLESRE